jgi:hypothetical protein
MKFVLGRGVGEETADARSEREAKLALLRRERVERPVIYVGAGTCGLGAGAGKTLEATRAYLAEKELDADLVEVGCIGICSDEPLVDVQLPGRTRVSFRPCRRSRSSRSSTGSSPGEIPRTSVLGQFPCPKAASRTCGWTCPWLDEHPFFAPQTRWVLENCGLIAPTASTSTSPAAATARGRRRCAARARGALR